MVRARCSSHFPAFWPLPALVLHPDSGFKLLAMAPQPPEPQSLKSWQEAFQYPIPTVRRVEQELRRDIASSQEKLRALVGYVTVLGTLSRPLWNPSLIFSSILGRDIGSFLGLPRLLFP